MSKPKKKKTDLQKKIDHADDWFSRRVRLEESWLETGIGACFCCGQPIQIKYADCGHFFDRRHKAIRWERMNAHLQKKDCNSKMGHPEVNQRYRMAMERKYGKEAVDMLEIQKNNTMKLDAFKLDLIIEENKQIVNKLLKEKGIEKWW